MVQGWGEDEGKEGLGHRWGTGPCWSEDEGQCGRSEPPANIRV